MEASSDISNVSTSIDIDVGIVVEKPKTKSVSFDRDNVVGDLLRDAKDFVGNTQFLVNYFYTESETSEDAHPHVTFDMDNEKTSDVLKSNVLFLIQENKTITHWIHNSLIHELKHLITNGIGQVNIFNSLDCICTFILSPMTSKTTLNILFEHDLQAINEQVTRDRHSSTQSIVGAIINSARIQLESAKKASYTDTGVLENASMFLIAALFGVGLAKLCRQN
jgi:hypothetical protein